MARRQHWLSEIVGDVRERIHEAIPFAIEGLHDTVPFGTPPEQPPPPSLDAFMKSSPDERQAFFASIPPDKYREVTDALMSQANDRYGSMAKVLHPMFQNEEISSLLQHTEVGQATGIDANLGVAAAHQDLAKLLGIDPWSQ